MLLPCAQLSTLKRSIICQAMPPCMQQLTRERPNRRSEALGAKCDAVAMRAAIESKRGTRCQATLPPCILPLA